MGGWLHSEKVQVDDGEVLFEKGPRTLRPAGNGILMARLVRPYLWKTAGADNPWAVG